MFEIVHNWSTLENYRKLGGYFKQPNWTDSEKNGNDFNPWFYSLFKT